jgi:hypothetical protein
METTITEDGLGNMNSREQRESNRLLGKLFYASISLMFLSGGTWVVARVLDHEKVIERHSVILESHTKVLTEIHEDVQEINKDIKLLIQRKP